MKINISGHHLTIKDSIKEHTSEKLTKISEHFPDIIAVNVILSIDNKKVAMVEMDTVFHSQKITIKETKDDMFQAVTSAVQKLHRVLTDKKGIEQANRSDHVDEVEPDHTHEHIQNLNLSQ
jgi:putative sigma-54 modulation protein